MTILGSGKAAPATVLPAGSAPAAGLAGMPGLGARSFEGRVLRAPDRLYGITGDTGAP